MAIEAWRDSPEEFLEFTISHIVKKYAKEGKREFYISCDDKELKSYLLPRLEGLQIAPEKSIFGKYKEPLYIHVKDLVYDIEVILKEEQP